MQHDRPRAAVGADGIGREADGVFALVDPQFFHSVSVHFDGEKHAAIAAFAVRQPEYLEVRSGPGGGGLRTPVSEEFVVFVARAGFLIRATPKAVCSL